jgi:hypothetical protein
MVDLEIPITNVHMNLNIFANMEHNVILVQYTMPLVLGLYIVVYLYFITRRVNKFSTTLFKHWGPLLETIASGVPNRIKTRSYRNCATLRTSRHIFLQTL